MDFIAEDTVRVVIVRGTEELGRIIVNRLDVEDVREVLGESYTVEEAELDLMEYYAQDVCMLKCLPPIENFHIEAKPSAMPDKPIRRGKRKRWK